MFKTLLNKLQENYFLSFIYLYIFIMPWNFSNGIMGLSSIILLVWWLIIGRRKSYFFKLKNIFKFKPLLFFILFLLWSYLSLLWTEDFEWAEIALKYYKYYWIMIPVLFTTLSKEEALNAFYIFIISLGIYALFSVSIALGIVEILDSTTNPNSTANPRGILSYAIVTPYMAIATLSALFMALRSKTFTIKLLFAFISLIALVALFLNNGRAGQFAFISTLFILFIIYRRYIFNIKILLGIIFTILLASYILTSTGKIDRLLLGLQEIQEPEKTNYSGSFNVRIYLWKAAIELIPNHPIIGSGTGDNINEFIEYTKTHPSGATWIRTYHNQHLDTLTKYGIIGYLLLWGSVISLLISLRKYKYYFTLALIFFSITFFDALGDIILLMKPYNNIFMLLFLLFSIISFYEKSPRKD